jgi:hypothetical protein
MNLLLSNINDNVIVKRIKREIQNLIYKNICIEDDIQIKQVENKKNHYEFEDDEVVDIDSTLLSLVSWSPDK